MPVFEPSEEQVLIEQACSGSLVAFEKLVLCYQDRLYRFLLIRAENPADAEDALQETFVAAFKYLPSYHRRYLFSTWLFTIALRELNRLKRRKPEHGEMPDSVACELPGPEQAGICSERKRSVWRTARSCLGDAQFSILCLFYIEDMPLAEIAVAMKRPVGWVKVNLMRARRRLSGALQDQNIDYTISRREVRL